MGVVMIQFHHTWIPFIHEEYPYLIFDDEASARKATEVLLRLIRQEPDVPEKILVPVPFAKSGEW